MMRYAASRGNGREMRSYDDRGMYSEMNDRPEMRRRRDSRGRYMAMEEDSPERIHYDGTDTGYMDDGMILKKFGLTDPMVFACLAKAWLEDADAVEDKTAKYYKCIVKK
ncbi:MAG: hypothetical protein PUD16_03380 [bacterium]|nr:hypothetical protein [bacterium]